MLNVLISILLSGLTSWILIKIHLSNIDKWIESFFKEEDKRIKDYLRQILQK